MESVEISARSVDEAIDSALEQLGVKLSEVEIVVLSKGRAGILGVGAEDARVRVSKLEVGRTRMSAASFPPRPPVMSYATDGEAAEDEDDDEETPPPEQRRPVEERRPFEGRRSAPAPERRLIEERRPAPPRGRPQQTAAPFAGGGPTATTGMEVLSGLLDRMGFQVEVVETEPPGPTPTGGEVIAYDIRGEDLGVLIGRRGQTLSSLQYLMNLMVNRRLRDPAVVVVDVEGYRARRYNTLRGLAQRMADRVRSGGQSITLEPMNAAERRIIHLALQDYRDVTTQSVGEGDNRKVSIVPRKGGRGSDRQS